MDKIEKANKKELIKAVARELFTQNGYAGTSTRDICKMANVNISMISYYFGSKEGLFNAIVEDFKNEVTNSLSEFVNLNIDITKLSEKEKIEILCDFVEVGTEFFYKNITKEMIDFILSVRHFINLKILPAPFEFVRGILASIMKKTCSDKEVIFKTFSIVSPIMFPKIMTHISLPSLMQTDFKDEDITYIKKVAKQNIINFAKEQGVENV